MSTHERWIVYPLLFLTLGIAMREKVIPPAHFGSLGMQLEAGAIEAPRIRCNELQVTTVVCNRLESEQLQCRALFVNGPNGRPVVVAGADAKANAGTVETFTATGAPQVRLLSTDTGGMVTTIGHAGKVLLVMGHTGKNFGVFAQVPELGPPIPLTLPWRFEAKPSSPEPPKGSPAPTKPSEEQSPQKPENAEKKDRS